MVLISPIYGMAIGNFDAATWKLMYNLIIPFDKTHIFGWFVHYVAQFNVGLTYSLILVSITSYFVCCCFYVNTICDHFDHMMQSIESNGMHEYESRPQTNWRKVKQQLSEAINLHVDIFE